MNTFAKLSYRERSRYLTLGIAATLVLLLLPCLEIAAQPAETPAVGFTRARTHRVNQRYRLPGTVRSRLVSTVASEVSGLVLSFPVREGQTVKEGEVLARLRRENLELRLREAQAQLDEDEARLALAERTMNRTRDLLEKGAVSQQDVDDRVSEFNALERRKERLKAVIDRLEDDLDRTVIKAPFSGVVISEVTQVGEWINVGGAVVELMSVDELEVEIDLPERYFSSVRKGTKASVSFEALPDVRVTGVTSAVIPLADSQARTFPVRLRIPNLGGRIGVGMLAQVDLSLSSGHQATIVPKDAVISRGRAQLTYIIDGEDVVRQTEVRTLAAYGAWVEIEGQIEPGQRIVTRGNERLRDGQKIRLIGDEVEYDLP